MSRKNRPYLFYDTTSSVCSTCLYPVEAKIIIKADSDGKEKVYMDKWCPEHGSERVLIMDDADYYRLCREVYIKQPELPQDFATRMQYGCPYDCGLCPDHMQHACLSIVEITDVCNLDCPVCYADSGASRAQQSPHLPYKHKSMDDIKAMFEAILKSEGEADVVQISGGEPTMHPQFFDILTYAKSLPIKHIMINTNGIRIAKEPDFVARLASYLPAIEVYLQFDSLNDDAIYELRGAKLAKLHEQALANLDKHNLSTTLVMTLKKGLNDHEMGAIIEKGLAHRSVRGVTFQPIQDAGRVEQYDPKLHRLTVSEIRRHIAEQSDVFTLADIVPVPCNPDTLAMGYALRNQNYNHNYKHKHKQNHNHKQNQTDQNKPAVPLTRFIDPQTLIDGASNTIVFERDEQLQENVKGELKDKLFKVMSTNHSPSSQANCLSELLCCLPQIDAPQLGYDSVFRIMIVQFMDAHSLDIRALKKSCIHFAQPNGQLIPFESFNLFYRDDKAKKLAEIRQTLSNGFASRTASKTQINITNVT